MANQHNYSTYTNEQMLQLYQQQQQPLVLATLFLRYSDLVYGVCVKYLKNQEIAKDSVTNIYEELTKKILKHEVANFKSWLYVLSKNYCLMQLRSAKKILTTELTELNMQSEPLLHLEEVLARERHLNLLQDCIDQLNEEQQQTIQLFYLQEKCYNEIVTITGLEWNRVRSLIQNGKRNLKICMDKHE